MASRGSTWLTMEKPFQIARQSMAETTPAWRAADSYATPQETCERHSSSDRPILRGTNITAWGRLSFHDPSDTLRFGSKMHHVPSPRHNDMISVFRVFPLSA